MKRRIPILLLLVLLVSAGVYYYPRLFPKREAGNKLLVSGNIEAHESLVGFKVQGRIVQLPVDEGQWVEQGTLLARLDDSDFRQKVSMDEATVHVRDSNLALTLAGARQQEIEAARQNTMDANADLELKKLDYERAKMLFSKDTISAQDRDRAETALKRSEATAKRAKEQYDQVMEGARKEEIAIARANVRQANESLKLSRINLSYTTLTAPSAGVISVRQAELGEVVSPGTPVVKLADIDHIWLRAYISESDLGRVHWGQAVAVRTDTYPGKTYKGRISFISPEAEFTPKSVQTFQERVMLVYRIKIDVENPNRELKPGMPADGEIELTATTK